MPKGQNPFPHLRLPLVIKGPPVLPGGGSGANQRTKANLQNRASHSEFLRKNVEALSEAWSENIYNRAEEKLPELPQAIPLYLQIDPDAFDPDGLRIFGIEVIGELEDGWIIGASADINLGELRTKIEQFANEEGRSKNTAAKLWEIVQGKQWRVDHILCPELFQEWASLQDERLYVVDVSIACAGVIHLPNYPIRQMPETDEQYQARFEKKKMEKGDSAKPPKRREGDSDDKYVQKIADWEKLRDTAYMEWDELYFERSQQFEEFIRAYNGEILNNIAGTEAGPARLPDSFSCRVRLTGAGLRDLVLNFPYLFDVCKPDVLSEYPGYKTKGEEKAGELYLLPPNDSAPKVCIIDSGIQEGHRFIVPCIDSAMSKCYIPGETDVADHVKNGGHGTRVGGAVLFPRTIPTSGRHQLSFWLQNARVLNEQNKLPDELFPPAMLKAIVDRYHFNSSGTRIFNHSITGFYPCRSRHMSAWAAAIDQLSWEADILFIVAAGNLKAEFPGPIRLGIANHLAANRQYPQFLMEDSCRIANPAQSFQALTVGSICHTALNNPPWTSFGDIDYPSVFSATGLGIWGVIKPDVVEYGGDMARDTGNPPNISYRPELCPELIRSTLYGGPGVARDNAGTSFAAPKVAHIAAAIQQELPDEPCLLYRALIAQSARWPKWADTISDSERIRILRHIGYGLPDIERATTNNNYRVTLITNGSIPIKAREAHIYQVPIPAKLRTPGELFSPLTRLDR